MNNGSKPSVLTLNAEITQSFGACALKAKMSPVTRINVSGFEGVGNVELTVSVMGKCEDTVFLKRSDFVRECFDAESYNLKSQNSCALDFNCDSFEYDVAYLNSLEEEKQAEIYVLVKAGNAEAVAKAQITLLPFNMWTGLEAEPSAISSFAVCEDKIVGKLCEEADGSDNKMSYSSFSKKKLVATVKELYKKLKECNIIYTRPAGYSAGNKQRIRLPEELFNSSSVLATPLEIALMFISVAEKSGFDTSLLFMRGAQGEISVLCGVYLVKSPVNTAVCENRNKIASLVNAGDLLIVEPSVFAAAQNTSFSLACENTAEMFLSGNTGLVCLVDIKKSKVLSGEYDIKENELYGVSPKAAVSQIYSSLAGSPVMQLLSGKRRDELQQVPLLLTDFDKTFYDTQNTYRLLPLEFNVNLEDFAAIDKGFSSIVTCTSPMANQHFSNNELVRIQERFENLKAKITRDDAITTSLRDEDMYMLLSEMTFGKNKKSPYFAFGYVKITDKLTEIVGFAPVCLVKAKVIYDSGHFYVKQNGQPIVNKVFIRNALKNSGLGYDSFMKSVMPTDKKEIFDMFENIKGALSQTDDRRVYEIVKEAHLVNVDLDDYVLWSNLALEREKLSENITVSKLFGAQVQDEREEYSGYIPPSLLYSSGEKAVCYRGDTVITGAFQKEKEKVLSCVAAKSITDGKSMLVVADDEEAAKYAEQLLSDEGYGKCTVALDENGNSDELIEKLCAKIEEYKESPTAVKGMIGNGLFEARELLHDYVERINTQNKLGMSLSGAAFAYLYACKGQSRKDDIFVDKHIFKGADVNTLDKVFEETEQLIATARKVCSLSGLEEYTAICKHPLFNLRPKGKLSSDEKDVTRQAVGNAISVLSEYRDVFYDVNEILGIDEREIDNLDKLERINELYMLVLSARDVDIPEKFIESDISGFSKNKRFFSETMKRMEAIEFKLNFFNREIFEDVETLLKGDEYEEEQAGLLRKFMIKKNYQDTLLQYVDASKRAEFQQHKTADVYKLLYEYKACVKQLRYAGEQQNESLDENSMRLALIAETASNIIENISKASEQERKKRLANVFRLISVIPVDASLARKITVTRARLAEMCATEQSAITTLTGILGVDFYSLEFESGILSFDGFAKYLEDVERKLDATDIWLLWLEKSEEARKTLPYFVEYLEKHGAGSNVERLFAKSLLSPVAQCIKEDSFKGFSHESLGKTKDKYFELSEKASVVSFKNVFECHTNIASHIAKTNTPESLRALSGLDTRELFEKQFTLITKLFPVIVVTKNSLTDLLPLEACFDNVVVLDNKDNGFGMLPAVGFGKRTVLVNMSRSEMSSLCALMSKSSLCTDVCRFTEDKDISLYSWINSKGFDEKGVCINGDTKPVCELVRMNGIFDRTDGRTNKTECELSMVKATEMLADKTKTVVITAFTKEQCSAIERLLHVIRRKNKTLSEAIDENRVSVCTPDRLFMKKYDGLVVCATFGADKDGRIGWDFGYAGVVREGKVPEAYISIADKKCERICILTSLNAKDTKFIRKTGKNSELFNSLCEILTDGRIPVCMNKNEAEEETSLVPKVLACVQPDFSRFVPCVGKTPVAASLYTCSESSELFVLCDNDSGMEMHDMLLIKEKLKNNGKAVVTLMPTQFAGYECKETLESLEKGKGNERIRG